MQMQLTRLANTVMPKRRRYSEVCMGETPEGHVPQGATMEGQCRSKLDCEVSLLARHSEDGVCFPIGYFTALSE